MIIGAPPWREIGLLLVILFAFVFVGGSIGGGSQHEEMVIAGSVSGDVDEDVDVTIIVQVNTAVPETDPRDSQMRESMTVPETIHDTAGNESVVTYSIPIDRGGRYYVQPRTSGTSEYLAYPSRTNRSMLEQYAFPRADMGMNVELTTGERAENVNFTLYDADMIAEGEKLPFDPNRSWSGSVPNQTGEDQSVLDFSWVMAAILSLLGLLALQFVRAASGDLQADHEHVDHVNDESQTAPVDAYDDIPATQPDHPSFENDVYRAWHRMARTAGVSDPQELTAGELEQQAVAAGLPSEPVHRLTELFNEVRYGGADADAYAAEAIDTLQTIESTPTSDGENPR